MESKFLNPRYRRLTLPELQELEKEFVEFLIINGIEAREWESMKVVAHERVEAMITLFSDVVFEGILRKVTFLEFRSPQDLKTFQCLEEKMVLVGLNSENASVDFTHDQFSAEVMQKPPEGIRIYNTSKPYNKSREAELFDMFQAGCTLSDGRLFKVLSLAL